MDADELAELAKELNQTTAFTFTSNLTEEQRKILIEFIQVEIGLSRQPSHCLAGRIEKKELSPTVFIVFPTEDSFYFNHDRFYFFLSAEEPGEGASHFQFFTSKSWERVKNEIIRAGSSFKNNGPST